MTPEQEEQLKRESAFAVQGNLVLNNEAFKQAITLRKAQIFELFCRTKPDQTDVREEAWRTMVNINALEDYLTKALSTGKMADSQLESMLQSKDKH